MYVCMYVCVYVSNYVLHTTADQALGQISMLLGDVHYTTNEAQELKCDILMSKGKVLEARATLEQVRTFRGV